MADENMADMPIEDEVTPEASLPTEEPTVETGAAVEAVTETPEKKGFFSTTGGKFMLIGGSLALLLTVAAIVAFLVFTFVFVDNAQEIAEDLMDEVQAGAAAPASSEEEEAASENELAAASFGHATVSVSKVHVWRDIFQPLLTPIDPDTTSTVDGVPDETTPDGGTAYEQDTLYLLDILTGSGETAAQFYFNGIDYNTSAQFTSEDGIVVLEGDRLADTPWRLLNIGVTSVTLQYGDSTVGLSIGQGIQK